MWAPDSRAYQRAETFLKPQFLSQNALNPAGSRREYFQHRRRERQQRALRISAHYNGYRVGNLAVYGLGFGTERFGQLPMIQGQKRT